MEAALERGAKFGRPYGFPESGHPKMLRQWYSGKYTKTSLARAYGVHISSIKRAIKRHQEKQQLKLTLENA